jgi:uncharacterized protein DUF4232
MNLRTIASGRLLAGLVTCAAVLVPATALASSGSPASALASAGSRASDAVPGCATSGLDVWLDTQGSGAAGTIYYDLEFTNLSGASCTLFGYPGVSGVSLSGTQVGNAASRDHAFTPHVVTLANGATATAIVGIKQVSLFPPAQCKPVTAAGLRVYPPGQTASKVVPFPFGACSKTGPVYLTVMTVR